MSDKEKRLDYIETRLTPKEWAIQYATDLRKYPNHYEYAITEAKAPNSDGTLFKKAYNSLGKQAEERYYGNTPEIIDARCRFGRRLCSEFMALSMAIIQINQRVGEDSAKFTLESKLQLSIFMNQRLMLEEADLWMAMEEWTHNTSALLTDIFAYQAAVNAIQEKHFDAHPILAIDVEAALQSAENLIKLVISQFDGFVAIAIRGKKRNSLAIEVAKIKDQASREQGPKLASEWMRIPKAEALLGRVELSDVKRYEWQYYQEIVGIRQTES